MVDVVTVHLRFGVDTPLGLYQDTLSFTEDEWAKRDAKAIEVAKQALANTWVTFRSAQIAEEEGLRTIEGKQAKIAELDSKIADLTAVKDALAADVAMATITAAEATP